MWSPPQMNNAASVPSVYPNPRPMVRALNLLLAAGALVVAGAAIAQPFTAPCPAPDSVLTMYRDDADRLALARTYRNGTPWADSISIDPAWSATAMNALVAMYNSALPARDTVVAMLDIHVFPAVPLRAFYVNADSTLPWMQQLHQGNIPTGNPAIDQLLSAYAITLTDYHTFTWLNGSHLAVFSTGANVNLPPLCALFAAQPGVHYAEPNGGCCDGNTITDSVHTDHVNIVYSHGWGDCPAGCTARRFWEFNVYPDCSVEYVGSHGTPLYTINSIAEPPLPLLSIFPNPAQDVLWVRGAGGSRTALVHAADGRLVSRQRITGAAIDIGQLPAGLYVLRLEGGPAFAPVPFVKQ